MFAGDMVATLPMAFEYAKIQLQVNPEFSGKSYFDALKHTFSKGQGKGIIFSFENISYHFKRLI